MDFLHRLRAWIRAADPAAGCGVRALNAGRPLAFEFSAQVLVRRGIRREPACPQGVKPPEMAESRLCPPAIPRPLDSPAPRCFVCG